MEGNDSLADAKNKALRYIGYKPRTTLETRRKLCELGFAEGIIESVLSELSDSGILDDGAYAKAWVEERQHVKHLGRQRIKSELVAKGVDRALIEDALALYPDDEEEVALEFLARKYRSRPQSLEPQKLIALLQRNGFSYSISQKAVHSYMKKLEER